MSVIRVVSRVGKIRVNRFPKWGRRGPSVREHLCVKTASATEIAELKTCCNGETLQTGEKALNLAAAGLYDTQFTVISLNGG